MNEIDKSKLFSLGLTELENKQFQKAIEIFSQIIERFPSDFNLYVNRGIAYDKISNRNLAEKDFLKAIELNPDCDIAYYNLANMFYKRRNFPEAIKHLESAININPDDSRYYNTLGTCYASIIDYENAINCLNKSIELDSMFIDPLLNLGNIYKHQQNFRKALEFTDKALDIDPSNFKSITNKIDILMALNVFEKALVLINQLIDKNKKNEWLYNKRGIIYANQKVFDLAYADFDKSTRINRNILAPKSNKALVRFEQENYEEAVKLYRKIIRFSDNNPDHIKYFFVRGCAYFYLNDNKKALKDLLHAENIGGNDNKLQDSINIFKGLIYFRQRKFEESEELLKDISIFDSLLLNTNIIATETLLDAQMSFKSNTNFFQKVLTVNGINDINDYKYSIYKNIYIKILQVISLLHVDNLHDNTVAHYTQKTVSELLLFSNSTFRMHTVLTANDPEEGKVLNDFLELKKNRLDVEENENSDYQAFISSFTFNHDCLNQFRLYGKENNREATGVSLVLNSSFFEKNLSNSMNYQINTEDEDEDQNIHTSENKYCLFRCIYIDPLTKEVISIGHRETYTFYRAHNFTDAQEREDAIEQYNDFIQKKFIDVRGKLRELKDIIGNECANLDPIIISELLITLSYLVKHMAFKEEQECRILSLEHLTNNNKILPKIEDNSINNDFSRMYIEYTSARNYIEKVYFAPKATGYSIFKDQLKRLDLRIKCVQSKHPLS